jgi:putative ABC transport system substrate-binding protein
MPQKRATATIPIVFLTGADPVKEGVVASLARPGANLTGITTLNVELGPKRFEVLHELAPTSARLGVLINPINSPAVVEADTRQADEAAHALGLQIDVLHASTEISVSAQSHLGAAKRFDAVAGPHEIFWGQNCPSIIGTNPTFP